MSKLTTGVGHMYVQATNIPIGLDIRMSNPCYQLGHTYVQPLLSAWTYVCPTPTPRLDIRMYISSLDMRMSNPCCQLGHTYVQPGHMYVQPDYAFRHIRL